MASPSESLQPLPVVTAATRFRLSGWRLKDDVVFTFACDGLFPELQTSDGFYDWDCGKYKFNEHAAAAFLAFLRSLPREKGVRRKLIKEAICELKRFGE